MKFLKVILMMVLLLSSAYSQSSINESINVAIFLNEGVEVLDFAGPGEVFAATSINGARPFNVYTVAVSAEPITSQGFIKITSEYTIANCPKPDILVISGGGTSALLRNPELISWVEEISSELDIALSVCTGAFVFAKAGLLDGKKATTWFRAIQGLRNAAPNTEVLEDTRFVDNGRVVTTAGVSAGIDGALHVVSRLMGEDVARSTAQYMQYDKWIPEDGYVIESETLTKLRSGQPVDAEEIGAGVYGGELRNIGRALLKQKRPSDALKVFAIAIKLYPELSLTHLDIAEAHKNSGDKGFAGKHYLKYLQGNQGDLEIADQVGFGKAFGFYKELAKKHQLDEQSMNVLGYKLMNNQRMGQALEVFELNVKAHPNAWNANDSLAEAWMKNGNNKKAINFYRKSLELNPDNKNAREMIKKLGGTN